MKLYAAIQMDDVPPGAVVIAGSNKAMLSGWKVIAGYLRRDERTAMRWAAERGMPVHRTPGRGRGTVYALPDELDAWFAADRELALELGRRARDESSVGTVPQPWSAPSHQPGLLSKAWIVGAVIAAGFLLAAFGTLTLVRSRQQRDAIGPAFTDPTAKALFLQANYDWNLRTPESLLQARQEFSDAIGHDPGVPAAYVGLANTYLLLREFGTMPEADAYPRAEAAARTAISLAPDSADAHRALGFVAFWWRQDRVTARREFLTAIALKPADSLTHHWYATALLTNGEFSAALREIDLAQDLDPTGTATLADRGVVLYAAGRRAEGRAILSRLAREQPEAISPHRQLALIELAEGRPAGFLREAAVTARLRGDTGNLAHLKRWSVDRDNITDLVAAMLVDAKADHAGWFRIAELESLANRPAEAKDALARACRQGGPNTTGALANVLLQHALSARDIAERCDNHPLMAS